MDTPKINQNSRTEYNPQVSFNSAVGEFMVFWNSGLLPHASKSSQISSFYSSFIITKIQTINLPEITSEKGSLSNIILKEILMFLFSFLKSLFLHKLKCWKTDLPIQDPNQELELKAQILSPDLCVLQLVPLQVGKHNKIT